MERFAIHKNVKKIMIHEIIISNMTEKKRDPNLDIMKGIGILLVIFAHIFHNSGIIYQFHMPLFFILSGAAMTYSSSRYSFKKKFKTLLIPYLGSAELIHSHRLRGADVPPHCDNGDENSPYFGKDKTKFP